MDRLHKRWQQKDYQMGERVAHTYYMSGMNKWNLVKSFGSFPWFAPTIHSWFKDKWDEEEDSQTENLGKDLENAYNELYRKASKGLYTTYDFLQGAPYRESGGILEIFESLIRHRKVSVATIERIFKEMNTELCTRSVVDTGFVKNLKFPPWYYNFLYDGCAPLKINEDEVATVLQHIHHDIDDLEKQGEVWKGVGYDNEKRYIRHVDKELYGSLDKIFLEHGVIESANTYFNYPMILDGVTLHVCKENDKHWQMTMADHPPTKYENLHFDPKNGMLKCIFYLDEVTEDSGPFSYVRSSHAWEDSSFNRVCAKGVAVSNYMQNDEERYQFLELPRNMQKCANIGAFLQDDVPEEFTKEKRYTSSDGNLFFFDPGGLHRGGIVNSGRRINLQIMFRLSHNGQTVPFI